MTVDKAAAEILGGGKYSGLDRAAVERICASYIPRYPKYGDAIKAIKKELHIIYGSFLTKDCHAKAESLISGYSGKDIYSDKDYAIRLMMLHASTAERASRVADIFTAIGGLVGQGDSLIDIGCGFNPFTLPFYPMKPKAYIAYDICARTTSIINSYFKPLGPEYLARPLDAAANTPKRGADVILMYKIFPLLEHQRKGCAFEMLNALDFRAAIISFPTKSASGREKGMETHYTNIFERGLPQRMSIARKIVFNNELFFIITC